MRARHPGRARRAGLRLAGALLGAALAVAARPASAADAVTEWTLLADAYGGNAANWRTLAIMHQAMHDALNAALPTYARWAPANGDEPASAGAMPQAAMSAAAARVLLLLHPERRAEIERIARQAIERNAPSQFREAGVRLGEAVGEAAVARRAGDGYLDVRPFATTERPGGWVFTPQETRGSNTTSTRPFLFSSREAFIAPPPRALDTDGYRRDAEEVRRIGRATSAERTQAQTEAALFWAYQSSQRGYLHLAVRLLDERPRPGGTLEHARIMSQLTTALADSAILVWLEKERFSYWRPITALRTGSPGVAADPSWSPLIETPPFPEYPSGHAADCYTGSAVLQGVFGREPGTVLYVAQPGNLETPEARGIGMGQHAQPGTGLNPARRFRSFAAAAGECAESRIWAGAHFRPAAEEARRLGDVIAARAAAAVTPLLVDRYRGDQ